MIFLLFGAMLLCFFGLLWCFDRAPESASDARRHFGRGSDCLKLIPKVILIGTLA